MTGPVIGIIGGSGLYQIDGLADVELRRVESPFGSASDEFCFGTLGGTRVIFLPRHGRGHRLPPSAINFRANIDEASQQNLLAFQLRSIARYRVKQPSRQSATT